MNQSRLVIIVLLGLLVGSNVWWACLTFDSGITRTYMNDSLEHANSGMNQAEAILPLVARGANRDEIVKAAKLSSKTDETPFERDGYVFVGELGLKFDSAGKFVGIKTELP